MEVATKVHIISTPYITNTGATSSSLPDCLAGKVIVRSLAGAAGANKAAATKMFHDNQAAGVYTFNPNSGLRPAAGANFAVTSAPVLRLFQTFGPIDKSVVVLDY